MKYNRILLKLSGEALMGNKSHGIDPQRLTDYAEEIHEVSKLGIEIGIVIGGGNIFRGVSGVAEGIDRVKGDYMGMLATFINGLALQSAIEKAGTPARVFSSIKMDPVTEFYSKEKVRDTFNAKEIVIFVGGTGNPFFTTDTASALRAVEMGADIFLKGTRVDGVYNADPEKDPDAVRYEELSFDEALQKQLKIMDMTAFAMCRENKLPVYVFDMNTKGNLLKFISGKKIGTLVKN
ncbi:MAG: UMP kinase [Bacteroidales bacterium]|nr:UMP kinase [Bacteroidales bacterium]MCF8392190.1 UMP kinase [Bacteroidales bacterium]